MTAMLRASFCVCALLEALARFGRPETFNTEGSQFTSAGFTGVANGRRGAHLDERPWPLDGQRVHRTVSRSLKHEDIYLKRYADGREAFIFPREPSNTRQHLRQTGPQTFGSHLEL
jgi:hypothetical protein